MPSEDAGRLLTRKRFSGKYAMRGRFPRQLRTPAVVFRGEYGVRRRFPRPGCNS